MNLSLSSETETITIRPWLDDVIDLLGHDPRSGYVESYWLGILGPSTTWLLRRIAAGLDEHPEGFELPLRETARCLGLADKFGRNSAFVRALSRLVQFRVALPQGPRELAVRKKVPPLNRRQIERLPESLQDAHAQWQEKQLGTPKVEEMRERSRKLALSMLEIGEDIEATERQLTRWKFHPAMAHEAVMWAWDTYQSSSAIKKPLQLPGTPPAARTIPSVLPAS